jgi:hypothetical protein
MPTDTASAADAATSADAVSSDGSAAIGPVGGVTAQ